MEGCPSATVLPLLTQRFPITFSGVNVTLSDDQKFCNNLAPSATVGTAGLGPAR
jgi:hypothetical protein